MNAKKGVTTQWRTEFLKLQQDKLRELKEKIAQKTKILSAWKNPQNINDLNQIQMMQDHLAASLNNIKAKKRELVIEEQQRLQTSQREVIVEEHEQEQAQQ
ncbi:hypothetical protein JRO89_XS11G0064800 [Xanthoceras sorbifolium]|uniref:Uncharacterized protein n=1 Tax=Xanthoceras sorbifolium TaxID=99658 RepID=A0ABQ8HEX7_9ROSI|nr:hypothetical protein JRO89_XS11G0064800 [Xanthoceras sorbifolium]